MKENSLVNRILDFIIPSRRRLAFCREIEAIKADILLDGKVDFSETSRLLNFIQPFVRLGDENALKLKKLLVDVREDGKIDELESDLVTGLLDLISERYAKMSAGRAE